MEITSLVIPMIIAIAVVFLLRPVFLWYWKINTIEDLLREQIKSIDSLCDILKGPQKSIEKTLGESQFEILGVVFSFPDFINAGEKESIRSKAKNLRNGQLLFINSVTREIEFCQVSDYRDDIKNHIVAIKK